MRIGPLTLTRTYTDSHTHPPICCCPSETSLDTQTHTHTHTHTHLHTHTHTHTCTHTHTHVHTHAHTHTHSHISCSWSGSFISLTFPPIWIFFSKPDLTSELDLDLSWGHHNLLRLKNNDTGSEKSRPTFSCCRHRRWRRRRRRCRRQRWCNFRHNRLFLLQILLFRCYLVSLGAIFGLKNLDWKILT